MVANNSFRMGPLETFHIIHPPSLSSTVTASLIIGWNTSSLCHGAATLLNDSQGGKSHKSAHSYPRPQLEREHWTSLNGPWDFAIDPESQWKDPQSVIWSDVIVVPFSPETSASGIENTGFFSSVWYKRTFERPALTPKKRLILHFGAVDYAATVWVNGTEVCSHQGGYTPFKADITDVLSESGPQEIVRPGGGRSSRSRQASWKAGLEAGASLHLVSAHHRNLANRLA